jgi:hypothetical protein
MSIQPGDLINGLFECVGGILIWGNVRALMKAKMLRGVMWPVTGFFWAWGLWNLWFYPSLHQWLSFAGGIVIMTGNTVWLALAIKYRRN